MASQYSISTFIKVAIVLCLPLQSTANPAFSHISRVVQTRASPSTQAQTVSDLIKRVMGTRGAEFSVIVDPSTGPKDKDTFKLTSGADHKVTITGTSGVAAAWGFYYYVTQYGGGHVSWAGRQVNLPSPLPAVPSPGVSVTSNDKFRYYLNTCTMSYSFVWYDWASWEKQLDWMALHAINLPLAFIGQEAIWQRVYLKMGFTQRELDAHFAGPAFLAWQRMGNMHGWGGPLPAAWIKKQVALQHQVLQRMRDFGMTPVLPAFAGHVPTNITRLFPNASITHAGDWGGFNKTYCCSTLLNFSDPLFTKIGKSFIQEYTAEFGTDHVYNCDSFNENTPPKGDPAFIAAAGRQVFQGMVAGDPEAVWLMQGWLFRSDQFWTVPRAKALLTAVPMGRMIVLDMPSDLYPQYARLQSYFGQPFVWTMLHNFGGNVALYGALSHINKAPFEGRAFPDSSMVGIGLTMEGIFQNDVMYEFMMEHTWRKEPWNITAWISDYHRNRYGHFDAHADAAWQLLKSSVYNCTDPNERHGHGKNLLVRRPRINQRTDRSVYNDTQAFESHGTDIIVNRRPDVDMGGQQVWYKPEDLYSAWDHMVQASDSFNMSDLFRYDLVDVTRQSLQVIVIKYYADLNSAFKSGNITRTIEAGAALVSLVEDMERVLATDPHFLLGPWLESAKAKATTDEERVLYEYNARNQITLWGPTGNILDYANKQWSGMMADYYGERWKLFVGHLVNCLKTGNPFNRNVFNQEVFEKVETPFTHSRRTYPTSATGDSIAVVKNIHSKYRPVTFKHSAFFGKLRQWSGPKGKFIRHAMRFMRKQKKKDWVSNHTRPKDALRAGKAHQWSHEQVMQ